IKTVAVTAGYIRSQARREFFSAIDAANVDLKGFDDSFYVKLCGGKLRPVLETIEYLYHETNVWFEITTLLIPGANDSDAELHDLTEWVVEKLGPDVPLHFSAFHPDYLLTDRSATPVSTLQRARRIAIESGIRYAYTGNVHDQEGDSTYCHQCRSRLIGRDWYVLSDWNLTDEGECSSCGAKCAGRFDSSPGSWGDKRLPVCMSEFA
ncbi:MAG: AmmeMemoRadiSam system radical SAM enzyme, partial [Candidatus Zixiibacteriota bacterium]